MAETHTVFAHDTETPQVVSWVEIGEPNQQGYQRLNIAFGLGQGAIRSWMYKFFEDGAWSSPISDGLVIAGSTEVALRPDMPMNHLTLGNMRSIWQPNKSWNLMTDADDIFSGAALAQSDPNKRQYFTDVRQTWDFLVEQMNECDLMRYLPAVYYNANLSMGYQLSLQDQDRIGPLAGRFDTVDGPIHAATIYERMSLARELNRLHEEKMLIEQIQKLREVNPDSHELRAATSSTIGAVLTRAERGTDTSSVVLETANVRPFDTFNNTPKQIDDRIQHLNSSVSILMALEVAEARIAI